MRRPFPAACASLALAAAMAMAGCSAAPPKAALQGADARARLPMRGLAADETWQGEVVVRGSVIVPKGVTLTVLPGAVVRFEKLDVDGDGIGDSELYVEGRLVAEGTAARPIRFTSAEASPAPRDWKYIYLDLSEKSSLAHCVSEYAFSGVQIHFASASVRRCTFRHCVDGFRFSTADGRFEGNRMTGNVYGVRYEERNSRAELVGNEITGNQVGIFCVTASKGTATIRGNRILGNEQYDFKLGDRQRDDIPAGGNWWGTADPAAIRARIFDRGAEADLGRVLFEPPLAAPPEAGEGYGA
jgi:hypothetical protein